MSAQLLKSRATTESAWKAIEAEFGLFSARGVASLLQLSATQLEALVQAGNLLVVRRADEVLFPGFQFRDGRLLTAVGELVFTARSWAFSAESLTLWLCSPSTDMPQSGRPVDHLATRPQDVVDAAWEHMSQLW